MTCAFRLGFREHVLDVLIRPAPNFSDVSRDEMVAMLDHDEHNLVRYIGEVAAIQNDFKSLDEGFTSDRFSYYKDTDNDQLSREMLRYLNCRSELLDLVFRYRARHSIKDRELQIRASLVDLTAACALYGCASDLVLRFENKPEIQRKLNEGEPAWGIPALLYDTIRDHLNDEANLVPFRSALSEYQLNQTAFADYGLLEMNPYESFHRVIRGVHVRPVADHGIFMRVFREANSLRDQILYQGQSTVSRAVGSTRIRERSDGPRVTALQLEKIRSLVKPGDILIERQDWYLSRAFMPGYWAHAALYVGTPSDIEAMKLELHPWIAPHWKAFKQMGKNGTYHAIIEAVPDGVRFTTLEDCLGVADSAAVLRPKLLSENQIAEAIARAFHHIGKPYDFEFDFFSADKLVCTELVSRAYAKAEGLKFQMVNVMGRQTIPPTEMIRKFAIEREREDAQLEMILFYDGHSRQRGKSAVEADAAALSETVNRQGMTWFNSLD